MVAAVVLMALAWAPALVHAAPSALEVRAAFMEAPKPHKLDWDIARPNADFTSKRRDVHSEAYFNTKRSVLTGRDSLQYNATEEVELKLTKRATSGRWQNMGGNSMLDYPSACSWGGKKMDVYHYKWKGSGCYHQSYDNGNWGKDWVDLGGSCDSPPASCSTYYGKMDVYVKGTDGQCWRKPYGYSGSGWGSWEGMGGNVKNEPCPCPYGKTQTRHDLYVQGNDNQCWYRTYGYQQPDKWSAWESMGGYLDSAPKAVTWGNDHTSVYAKGDDGQCYHRMRDGGKWNSWESLGGSMDGKPSACAYKDQSHVYVKGKDHKCYHRYYQKSKGWSGWEDMGGSLKYAPDVVAYGDQGRMEVYMTSRDNNKMYRKTWDGSAWTSNSWEDMGGQMDGKPTPVEWDNGSVDVYGLGTDGTVKRCF